MHAPALIASSAPTTRVVPVGPRALAGMVAVIVLGCMARLIGLDHMLVWHDEVFTLLRVFGYSQAEIQQTLFSGQLLSPHDLLALQAPSPEHDWRDTLSALAEHPEHAPLYYLLARLATELPLSPVVAARGVAAACGALLVPAVYWLMRSLFGRGSLPWIAAAMVACSPLGLLYAQEARQYSLWLLLFVTSSAALIAALNRPTRLSWALYALQLTLGLYSHLLFLATLPIHLSVVLQQKLSSRPSERRATATIAQWLLSTSAAALAFTPWILVMLTRHHSIAQYTAWMQHPTGMPDLLAAWAHHIAAMFVDLSSGPELWWLVLTAPALWAVVTFVQRARGAGVALLSVTLIAYAALTLAPDLLLGGSRSLQARYALPALLSIQLMAAWVLSAGLRQHPASALHRASLAALALALMAGLASQLAILRADTWTSKGFSAENRAIAELASQGEASLVLASQSSVATGELISLAYHLANKVRIWGEPSNTEAVIPTDADNITVLTPSEQLRAKLAQLGPLEPMGDSWQWLRLRQYRSP